jgi:hypothetical protein
MPDTTRTINAQALSPRRTLGQRLDRVYHGFAIVGTSPTPGLRFRLEGLSLETTEPTLVTFQPRQNDNNENDWPDEFAVQVIETAQDHITGRVLRIDSKSGWGQDLRLDFLIIELNNTPG